MHIETLAIRILTETVEVFMNPDIMVLLFTNIRRNKFVIYCDAQERVVAKRKPEKANKKGRPRAFSRLFIEQGTTQP